MTTLIIVLVIIAVLVAVAAFVVRKKNREANIARAEQLRTQAATQAQSTIAPAQERAAAAAAEGEQARAAAAKAEAEAREARAVAARAEAEAEEARLAAQQVEATHEGQVRAADRIDPRVDHKADDYTPQVPGTTDQTPTQPSEAVVEPQGDDQREAVQQDAEQQDAEQRAAAQPGEADSPAAQDDQDARPPLLPRRTPGANEMPGKPIEQTDGGGGWFTKGSDRS